MGGPVSDDDSPTFTRYDWERIMRRVRFGAPMTKYVGMVLAQYANTDGSNAFPSVDKLARVCEVSEKTVRTALGELRTRGLIVRTRRGGLRGTTAYSDVHDLAIPADLLDLNDLLPPDEGPVPNRQDVPVGAKSKRNVRKPQPVTDASQPVTEGAPTGTSYRLPNPDQPLDQPTDQTSGSNPTQLTTGADALPTNVIQMRRRGA